MAQIFTVELPGADASLVDALAQEIEGIDGVDAAGSTAARALDAASIAAWVQIALATVTVIEKIASLVRAKGVKGATLTFPDGTVVKVDDVSPETLQKLAASKGQ